MRKEGLPYWYNEEEEYVPDIDDDPDWDCIDEDAEGVYSYDRCYECTGYGDDYYYNEQGDLICACDECPYNGEDEWEDY